MVQFKTVSLPATMLTVKEADMYTMDTANRAIAPVAQCIQEHARGGWHLHSYVVIPATIKRKKGIFEILLGWIPVLNMIWAGKPDFIYPQYYSVIFQREA